MARLILGLLLFSAIVLAVASVARLLTPAAPLPADKGRDAMPALFRNISYALLVALMFGVATGWLSGQ